MDYRNYHEPFLGGGAVFFSLNTSTTSYLSDSNKELIDAYTVLRDDVNGIIRELKTYENTKEFYYKLRSTQFRSPRKKAARFIFLNQTSFNGIYRVNLKGEYNVPFGFRKKNFLDVETLEACSAKLQNTELFWRDFNDCLEHVNPNDLVFLDPPYTITHNNNGFFKYNQNLFSKKDQIRLSKMIRLLRESNVNYILTNACHEEVKRIFKNGDKLYEVERISRVGGKKAQRGVYKEILLTNII